MHNGIFVTICYMNKLQIDKRGIAPKIIFLVLVLGLAGAEITLGHAFDSPGAAAQLTKTKETQKIYAEAISLFKAKRFMESKEKFLKVETMAAGYKSTKEFLNRIEKELQDQEDVANEEKQQEFLKQVRQEKMKERAGQKKEVKEQGTQKEDSVESPAPISMPPVIEQPLEIIDRHEIEEQVRTRKKELENQREEISREFNQRIEILYGKAVQLYEDRELKQAREVFSEVNALWPGYEQTQKYLVRIDSERELALSAPNGQKEFQKAEEQTVEVPTAEVQKSEHPSKLSARAKSIQDELAAVESSGQKNTKTSAKKVKKISGKERLKQDRANQKANAMYGDAMSFYLSRDYRSAKKKFLQLEKISPGYKSTRDYLKRIDRQLKGNNSALIKINGVNVE